MTIGFRVLQVKRRVSSEMADYFRTVPVANVSDVTSRLTAGGASLRPLHSGGQLSGPAFTVKTRPGDNLMLHKAIDMAEPGDVIVVDAGGDLTNSLMGEIMLSHAEKRGLAGVVVYGAMRDLAAIRANSFPVFACGVSHRGPYRDGPGELNVPIAIEGMVIEPGDLVIGDDDGLMSLPFDSIDEVYASVQKKRVAEDRALEQAKAGTSDRAWVDALLTKLGCEIVS